MTAPVLVNKYCILFIIVDLHISFMIRVVFCDNNSVDNLYKIWSPGGAGVR